MIDESIYISTVRSFFSFLVTEFGFCQTKTFENGNAFYSVEYEDAERIISVSYENIENYLLVTISLLKDGIKPEYDDERHTLHLSQLTKKILPKVDKDNLKSIKKSFCEFNPSDALERRLLKSATELKVILNYWKLLDFNN